MKKKMNNFNILFKLFIIQFICTLSNANDNDNSTYYYGIQASHFLDIIQNYDDCPPVSEKNSTQMQCVPKILCPEIFAMKIKPKSCKLPVGIHGYCCSPSKETSDYNRIKRQLNSQIHDTVIQEAQSRLQTMLDGDFSSLDSTHPGFHHHTVFHSSPMDTLRNVEISNSAMEQILATQILKDRDHIPIEDFHSNNIEADFTSTPLSHHCPLNSMPCPNLNSRYRSHDGTCNNPLPKKALWGSKGQPMKRLLPPAYEDGIWEPRLHSEVDGSPLEQAREISRIVLPDIHRPHPHYNLMVMQFGQFVAHDITQSSSFTKPNGDPLECCAPDGSDILPPEKMHFGCLPIFIEHEDDFYRKFNQRCMNFVRLSLSPNPNCKAGYGMQMSKVTHYLDGSAIYGSDQMAANNLRTFRGGKLRMLNDQGRELLPLATDPADCSSVAPENTCFKAGDGRVNQIISLTLVQTIFARQHNKIASILHEINPHYPDETIYQETRRIIVGILQHIIYNEYLPIIIGSATMKRFGLNTRSHGYSTAYNPHINVAVGNEFTAAAFRFGHSSVDGKFFVRHKPTNSIDEINIPDVMFNPNKLTHKSFLDDFVRNLVSQPMQQIDNSITQGLTKFLFRGKNPFGLDLAALNIQRGRDHALRPYNDYLEAIGHQRITNFNEFHPDLGNRLKMVYRHPNDMDLWLGGIIEPHLGDSTVGPTFAEIIGEQFHRIRQGDRYFYDNAPNINPGHFTPEQLQEIRKITLARVLCDNLDYVATESIPPKAFLRADLKENNPVNCNSNIIPKMNFGAWIQRH